MLFGNVERFAVEAEFLETHGKWTYGRLRFWVNGSPIGDFDDTSDLATSARWGRTFLKASPQRTRVELDYMASSEVYELLYGRFVEPVNTPSPKPWAGSWDREPYVLDDLGESAVRDKFAIVVVRKGDGSDRVLVNCFDEERVSETVVPPGDCDLAIEAYCAWVENLREGHEKPKG
jgi:hypothetical protein